MARSTPGISHRDFARLLTRWGCTAARANGSHVMWIAPTGVRFAMSHPGTHSLPTFKQVKNAANALGVSVESLLAGPSKANAA